MRIGIDATICITQKPTGLGVYTVQIVNALSKIHDDLVVWTVNDSLLKVDRRKMRLVMQHLRFLGDQLFYVRPLWVNTVLPKLLKEEGVDVVLTTVPSAMKHAPVRHVVTIHDVIPLTCQGEAPLSVYWNYKYRLPAILGNASAIISVSEYTKRDIQKYYLIKPEKIITVPEGYDNTFFTPQSCDTNILDRYGLKYKQYLLSVGNASPRKNLINLIRSFHQVSQRVSQNLVLVGAKRARELRELKGEIRRFGLGGRVMILNYVPYHDLPQLYSSAALVVYLSLYEGFGLPVLEAMACGTPVLASNTTSIPEVAGESAVLIDPTNCDSIADAIVRIFSDSKQLQRMSEAGLKRCMEFSWNKSAQQILGLLKTLVH
jgi:glycosyltransferase involved in cell wall biosynthesis